MYKDENVENVMERVLCIPVPNMPNCYVFISGKMNREKAIGEKWYVKGMEHKEFTNELYWGGFKTTSVMSFAYVKNGIAAEWDGEHGPIQLWWKSNPPVEGEKYDWLDNPEPKEHWIWPFAIGVGSWSQRAVSENQLPEAFNRGDYRRIFSVLKSFVDSRLQDV